MGMAPVAHVLFNKFMNFNPSNPDWVNRDRFILSYVTFQLLILCLVAFSAKNRCLAQIGSYWPHPASSALTLEVETNVIVYQEWARMYASVCVVTSFRLQGHP